MPKEKRTRRPYQRQHWETTYDHSICVDCAVFIANGELTDDEEVNARITDPDVVGEGHWDLQYEETDDPDDASFDLGFSWRRCDRCNSHLGGERYRASYSILVNT